MIDQTGDPPDASNSLEAADTPKHHDIRCVTGDWLDVAVADATGARCTCQCHVRQAHSYS